MYPRNPLHAPYAGEFNIRIILLIRITLLNVLSYADMVSSVLGKAGREVKRLFEQYNRVKCVAERVSGKELNRLLQQYSSRRPFGKSGRHVSWLLSHTKCCNCDNSGREVNRLYAQSNMNSLVDNAGIHVSILLRQHNMDIFSGKSGRDVKWLFEQYKVRTCSGKFGRYSN